jgi:hypothetical protein
MSFNLIPTWKTNKLKQRKMYHVKDVLVSAQTPNSDTTGASEINLKSCEKKFPPTKIPVTAKFKSPRVNAEKTSSRLEIANSGISQTSLLSNNTNLDSGKFPHQLGRLPIYLKKKKSKFESGLKSKIETITTPRKTSQTANEESPEILKVIESLETKPCDSQSETPDLFLGNQTDNTETCCDDVAASRRNSEPNKLISSMILVPIFMVLAIFVFEKMKSG